MLSKIFKSLIISVIALFLLTIGIDAADHYDNFSQSMIGKIVGNKPAGPCPTDMIFIPTDKGGFCIDAYEASPGKDCPNQEVIDQLQSRDNVNAQTCAAQSATGKKPWRFISQTQAMTACAKAGKRLPSNEEWYLASLGTPDLEKQWSVDDCHVSNNWSEQPGLTGSGKNCVSASGAFDMVGNVWEWVKGEINDGVYEGKTLPESGNIMSVDVNGVSVETNQDKPDANFNSDYFWVKNSGLRGMARGGYWDNGAGAGVYAMYLVSPPSFAGNGVGFRCAK